MNAPRLFDRWALGIDDTNLRLWTQDGAAIVECIEVDVRELPDRTDLLARLGPKARARLLSEAMNARARA